MLLPSLVGSASASSGRARRISALLGGEVSPTSSRVSSEPASSSPSPRDSAEDTSTGFCAEGAPENTSGTSPRASKVGLEATNSSRSLRWNKGMKVLGGYSWLSPTMRHRTASSSSSGRSPGLRRALFSPPSSSQEVRARLEWGDPQRQELPQEHRSRYFGRPRIARLQVSHHLPQH